MNKTEYLCHPDVKSFVNWSCTKLSELKVNFNISRKGTGTVKKQDQKCGYSGPGVQGTFVGLDAIANQYQWAAKYQYIDENDNAVVVESCDWASTSASLDKLSKSFQLILKEGDHDKVYRMCREILIWGGDRNPKVGASKFLASLEDNLIQYLNNSREMFTLNGANLNELHQVSEMNAMLTKVHAFASSDGLPIYDSRVAAAIGSIVEIYRQSEKLQHLPVTLTFPATDNKISRSVYGLNCISKEVIDPKRITRGTKISDRRSRAKTWSSCKIRLAWLIEAILEQSDNQGIELFNNSHVLNDSNLGKMHAFEAALFMIGFDVSCIDSL